MIFYFQNGWKSEFNDKNEKSCSWSRNKVSRKIDYNVKWLRNSHADSVGVILNGVCPYTHHFQEILFAMIWYNYREILKYQDNFLLTKLIAREITSDVYSEEQCHFCHHNYGQKVAIRVKMINPWTVNLSPFIVDQNQFPVSIEC